MASSTWRPNAPASARRWPRWTPSWRKSRAKLADTNFTSKVPQKVLDEHQQRKTDWQEKLAKLKEMMAALG